MTYCLPQALLSVQRKSSLVTGTKTGRCGDLTHVRSSKVLEIESR
jgi:hypothetical protein